MEKLIVVEHVQKNGSWRNPTRPFFAWMQSVVTQVARTACNFGRAWICAVISTHVMADWILDIIGLSPRDISLVSDSESFHSADSRPQTPTKVNPRRPQLQNDSTPSTEAQSPSRETQSPSTGNSKAHQPISNSIPGAPTPILKPLAIPLSPDEIVIPTIFLTQGARNSRLLKQGEEIARKMSADEARAARERDRLEQKRRAILAELNSNGSDFVYSMKTDAALVDSYVEKAFAAHDSVRAARHFYYFRDVKPAKGELARPLEVFFARPAGCASLRRVLLRHRIPTAQLVQHVLTQVYNEGVLEMVLELVLQMSADVEEEETTIKPTPDWSLVRAMSALGAEIPQDSLVLTLKYVHYNTNTGALVRRLAIVLLYYAGRITVAQLPQFVSSFILAALDFALNKYERAWLVVAMGRAFRALAARARALNVSAPDLLAPFHGFFARAVCRLFGESTVVAQKGYELHYTLIRNLIASGVERELVLQLAAAFLVETGRIHPQGLKVSVPVLAQVATDTARPGLARATARIFPGLYRAQLAAFLMPLLLADALAAGLPVPQKAPWRALHAKVLEAKDNLQQAVGTLLYMASEDVPDKVALSKALGETYIAFDHMSVVLDKNAASFRADIFYETH